ncbi:c-type cytochrome [Hymenobacter lapidiphilus]|nr:cytochrome c [Hymenobacter lapidiphilus]
MNKNLLEIIMPASLAVVAGAIGGCLLLLGSNLIVEPPTDLANQSACAGPGILGPNSLAPLPPLTAAEAMNIASGDALFKGNCAQCHGIVEVIVGPALAGVRKRRPEKWLHAWVKNSSKLVASGDEYALKIYEQYDKQQMPSYNLSNEEISQILDYVESQEVRYVVSAIN